jgi:putative phage-type endonuclease
VAALAEKNLRQALTDLLPDDVGVTVCPDEASWLEARRNGIGASEASAVLGENPYQSALSLYCLKLGITEPDDLSKNEAVEWGKKLEDLVAKKYIEETGRTLVDLGRNTLLSHPTAPFMLATLDRIIPSAEDQCDQGPGVLEIKTTGAHHADDWAEGVPRLAWIQVQHQLAVTGFRWASLAVLLGGQKFRWMDVYRDDAFISEMLEAEAEFWTRVTNEDPPEPDGTEASKRTLAKLYPSEEPGKVIDLAGECIAWDIRLEDLKGKLKAVESEKLELENKLRAALGDAVQGVLPNGVGYTLKSQSMPERVLPACTFRVLRRQKVAK